MSRDAEPTTIGLTDGAHKKLQRLREDRHFAEMADAYRFAIALALAHGAIADDVRAGRQTIFNIGTLDPERELYQIIKALRINDDEPVYRTAERLAEWGVEELDRLATKGTIRFGTLADEIEALFRRSA